MIDWIVYKENIYYGEVNDKGIPDGYGTMKTEELTFEGFFKNGKMEGLMNVKDSGDYRFQVLIRAGEVIQGKVHGEVEELIMDIGTYHGGVDDHMLPLGDGEFVMPDGTTVEGCWDEDGISGPFVMTTLKGSTVRGFMDKGRNNGYTTVEFCNGDRMMGYTISEKTEDGIVTRFDTIDLYGSSFGGNEECPDEAIGYFWDDYMELRHHPDVIYKESNIEQLYILTYQAMVCSKAVYGRLLFTRDGIFFKEHWHQGNEYEKIGSFPYRLRTDEEVRYFADRFYEEYHLHLTILNDSGEPNTFEWVTDHETFEEIMRKSTETEEVL